NREDGDEPLLAENAAVLQLGLGDAPDGGAVHVDVPARHRPGDPGLALDEIHHHAVLGQYHPFRAKTGLDGKRAVGHQVTDLPVHGHHVARADDVVHIQQLTSRGVPGDVHAGIGLVHHFGAQADQAVDDPEDGVLVPGDEGGSQDHGVAGPDADLVVAVGDAAQGRHRLPLGPGAHQHHAIIGDVTDLLHVDQDV